MNNEEMVAIVNQVVEIMEQKQRKASLEVAEALNSWKSCDGKGTIASGASKEVIRRAPHYQVHKKGGDANLPVGVSNYKTADDPMYKVTFRSQHIGVTADLDEAGKMRKAAEDDWDNRK